jgi:hypothetical protein
MAVIMSFNIRILLTQPVIDITCGEEEFAGLVEEGFVSIRIEAGADDVRIFDRFLHRCGDVDGDIARG